MSNPANHPANQEKKHSTFTLTPCKIRDYVVAPIKDSIPVEFTFTELKLKFAPTKSPQALQNLRGLQTGAFIGLSQDNTNFLICNLDRSDNIEWVVKQDEKFISSVKEIWRVESANYLGTGIKELGVRK